MQRKSKVNNFSMGNDPALKIQSDGWGLSGNRAISMAQSRVNFVGRASILNQLDYS